MSTASTVCGIFLTIISLTFAIHLTYYGLKFYQRRHDLVMIKRRGDLVIKIVFLAVIVLAIGTPLLFHLHWPKQISSIAPNPKSTGFLVADLLNDLLFTAPGLLCIYLLFLRYWLMYYDIQFSNSCSNLKWKTCICQKSESEDLSIQRDKWFIAHKKNLGNGSFMYKVTLTIAIIVILINIIWSTLYLFEIVGNSYYVLLNILILICMLITIIVLRKRITFFDDNIYLYKEFRMISIFWTVLLCLYMIAAVIRGVADNWVAFFAFYTVNTFSTFIMPFLSTFWVLKNIEVEEIMAHIIPGHTPDTPQSEKSLLREILSDDDTINLFMAHLINEFSMECLLSLIEFTQFRDYGMEMLKIDQEAVDAKTGSTANITFAADVPKSDIVYGDIAMVTMDDTLRGFKMKAYKLYRKYVMIGAEYEVNVSYRTRGILDKHMNDYDNWVNNRDRISKDNLVTIFDDVMMEMTKYLEYSRARFNYHKM